MGRQEPSMIRHTTGKKPIYRSCIGHESVTRSSGYDSKPSPRDFKKVLRRLLQPLKKDYAEGREPFVNKYPKYSDRWWVKENIGEKFWKPTLEFEFYEGSGMDENSYLTIYLYVEHHETTKLRKQRKEKEDKWEKQRAKEKAYLEKNEREHYERLKKKFEPTPQ